LFCVVLWCMDDYWYYSLLTLVMLMLFESTVTNTRLRTLGDMRRLATPMQVPLPPHVTPGARGANPGAGRGPMNAIRAVKQLRSGRLGKMSSRGRFATAAQSL
jgi:hypothetical protein